MTGDKLEPTVRAPVSSRRVLLYAPPPAPAPAYVSVLQNEGIDVIVAASPEAAGLLLDTASPSLIVAVVPVLGETLRDMFHRKAPSAEVRVLSSLGALLNDSVIPPREALDFCIRAVGAVSGLLASTRGVPRERTARVIEWSQKAATSLGFTASEVNAARLGAALYDIPHTLAAGAAESEATQKTLGSHWALVAEFAEGVGAPFPIRPPGSGGPSGSPTASDVVEAAAEYAVILERKSTHPALELRRRAPQLHPAAVEAVIAAVGGDQARANRGRILLVDGDAAARTLLALRIANEGYKVETAADGRSALESVRKDPPSLILSETVLPGLDGYAVLDTLKREGRSGIPFVFVSSRGDALSVNKGLLLGAADYLPKPVNNEVLLTKLQKLLGQALHPSEVSARISLSDVDRGPQAYPTVSYDDLAPDVMVMGRFRILAGLGEGGMGKVFKARDERLEEDVVIKVMKDSVVGDPKVLEHFKREIRLARKISHPAVVRTFDFWEAGPLRFVTMEFLEGIDLSKELARRGALPIPVAIRLATELFEGLAAAHDIGVVHRDIKPHNMLLHMRGHIKILDFGIAQGLDPTSPDARTITTTPIGTPEYMSPEQLLGERLDARTDLYSAGVVVFQMLTGRLPFAGADRMAVATQRLGSDAPRPSEINTSVPPEVDAFVLKLLRRSREERHASARAVLADLRGLRVA